MSLFSICYLLLSHCRFYTLYWHCLPAMPAAARFAAAPCLSLRAACCYLPAALPHSTHTCRCRAARRAYHRAAPRAAPLLPLRRTAPRAHARRLRGYHARLPHAAPARRARASRCATLRARAWRCRTQPRRRLAASSAFSCAPALCCAAAHARACCRCLLYCSFFRTARKRHKQRGMAAGAPALSPPTYQSGPHTRVRADVWKVGRGDWTRHLTCYAPGETSPPRYVGLFCH